MSNTTVNSPCPLLTESQAAKALGCSSHVLRSWRAKGSGPKFLRLGQRMVRYEVDALRRFALTKEEYSIRELADTFQIYPHDTIEFIGEWRESGYGKLVFSHTAQSDKCEVRWSDLDGHPRCHQVLLNEVLWTFEGNCGGDLLFVPTQGRPPQGPLPPKPKWEASQ